MKLYFIISIILLSSSFVMANPVAIEFEKPEYFTGETVQGKMFIGNIEEEIKTNNFHLEFNNTKTDVFPILEKYNNKTYFYFDLPYSLLEGSYNLVIEKVKFIEDNILVQRDLSYNISLKNRNDSVLSIEPAVIFIDLNNERNFKLNIKNPSLNSSKVNISIKDNFISVDKSSFNVNPGEIETVNGNIFLLFIDKNETSIELYYNGLSYTIPIFINNFDPSKVDDETEYAGTLSFIEDAFNINMSSDESQQGFIKIYNDLNYNLNDVKILLSESLKNIIDLEFDNINIIKGEVIKNKFFVNEKKDAMAGKYEGKIDLIFQGNLYDSIPIIININNNTIFNKTNSTVVKNDTKKEEIENTTNKSIIFIVSIFLLVVGFVGYRYLKSKKN